MKKLFITLVSLFSITAATLAATIIPPLPNVTFNTLSDMIAYPYPYNLTNAAITLNGYYAISDGGGGKFIVLTNIATTNYGTYFLSGGTAGWYYKRIFDAGEGVSVKAFGVKGDGTTDETTRLQAAIDWSASSSTFPLIFPSGSYKVTSIINMATDVTGYTNHAGSTWVGQGNYLRTIILGYTGAGNPIVDASGTRDWTCENMMFQKGNSPSGSTIGILSLGAQSATGSFAGHWRWKNVTVNVSSSPTANSNRGTVGLLFPMNEESVFDNCEWWANTPVVGGNESTIYDCWFGNSLTSWTLTSSLVPTDTSWSATKNTFTACRFIAYDNIGPCFHNASMDNLQLINCYFSQRRSHIGSVTPGTASIAIQINGPCRMNTYNGLGEGIGSALKIHGFLRDGGDVRMLLANSIVDSTNMFITNHLVDLTTSTWSGNPANGGEIRNSTIRIASDGTNRPAFLVPLNPSDASAPVAGGVIDSLLQFNQECTNQPALLFAVSRGSELTYSNATYDLGRNYLDYPCGNYGQVKTSYSVILGTNATTTAISNKICTIVLPSVATNAVGADVNSGIAMVHIEGLLSAIANSAATEVATANFTADLSIASQATPATITVSDGTRTFRTVKATTYATLGFVDDPTTNVYGVVNGNNVDIYLNVAMAGSSSGSRVRAVINVTETYHGWYKEAPYPQAP